MSEKMPERKILRSSGYDYSSVGSYFVTICSDNHRNIFSSITDNGPEEEPTLSLTSFGKIAKQNVRYLENSFGVRITEFLVMPNHIHFIIVLDRDKQKNGHFPKLGVIIGSYKAVISKIIHERFPSYDKKIWQRGYYEHRIRNQRDADSIHVYIKRNPSRWCFDRRKWDPDDPLRPPTRSDK